MVVVGVLICSGRNVECSKGANLGNTTSISRYSGNPKLTWFRLGPIPKEGRSLIVERYNPGQARTPAIAAEEIRGASEIVGHYQRCVVVNPCTAEGKARVET